MTSKVSQLAKIAARADLAAGYTYSDERFIGWIVYFAMALGLHYPTERYDPVVTAFERTYRASLLQ